MANNSTKKYEVLTKSGALIIVPGVKDVRYDEKVGASIFLGAEVGEEGAEMLALVPVAQTEYIRVIDLKEAVIEGEASQ